MFLLTLNGDSETEIKFMFFSSLLHDLLNIVIKENWESNA